MDGGNNPYILPADGYKSYASTNDTGVTSRLEIEKVTVDKHGKHNVTVTSNGGDAVAELTLYVIGKVFTEFLSYYGMP